MVCDLTSGMRSVCALTRQGEASGSMCADEIGRLRHRDPGRPKRAQEERHLHLERGERL